MPELPEVQTVVNSIQPILLGKKIHSVYCPNNYTGVFENGSLSQYQHFLIGKKIQSVYRRGKFIILKLNSGFLLIHLRMTGKIVLENPKIKNMKYVSFKLTFLDGSNPIALILELLKFFKNVPSFEPSSIIFELDLRNFFDHVAYFLKCSIINLELDV